MSKDHDNLKNRMLGHILECLRTSKAKDDETDILIWLLVGERLGMPQSDERGRLLHAPDISFLPPHGTAATSKRLSPGAASTIATKSCASLMIGACRASPDLWMLRECSSLRTCS